MAESFYLLSSGQKCSPNTTNAYCCSVSYLFVLISITNRLEQIVLLFKRTNPLQNFKNFMFFVAFCCLLTVLSKGPFRAFHRHLKDTTFKRTICSVLNLDMNFIYKCCNVHFFPLKDEKEQMLYCLK